MRAGDIGYARMWRSDLPPELKQVFGWSAYQLRNTVAVMLYISCP